MRLPVRFLTAFVGLASVFGTAPLYAQQAQNWSFEDGTLQGWIPIGEAFVAQPTFGNNVEPRRPGESPGSHGNWWIGSYENRPSESVALGTVNGDGPIGYLVSPPFVLQAGTISFLIGGGNSRSELALLMVKIPGATAGPGLVHIGDGYYRPAAFISANNREQMDRITWNATPYRGMVARILLSDQSSEPWGHLNVDDFRFSWVREPLLPPGFPGVPSTIWRKPPPDFRPARPLPMPPGDLLGGSMVLLPPTDGQLSQSSSPAPAIAQPVVGGSVTASPAPGDPASVTAVGGGSVVVLPSSDVPMARPTGQEATVMNPSIGVQKGPAMPLGGSGGPPPAPPIRYRLVASSFIVDHQTVDDMLERDGRGDEIFIRGDWFDYRDGGNFRAQGKVKSAVFGDRPEIKAGSARPGIFWADDQPGGLITNDVYPPGRDNFEATPSTRPGDLPIVLWEGTLSPGDAVLVVPSVWEWDGSETSRAEIDWDHWLSVQAPGLRLGAPTIVGSSPSSPPFADGSLVSADVLQPLDVYDIGSRPIGAMVWERRRGPGMRVPAIVLTYSSAFRASGQTAMLSARLRNPDGTVTSAEYLGPAGGIQMRFVDPPQLQGEYMLFLRLIRLN